MNINANILGSKRGLPYPATLNHILYFDADHGVVAPNDLVEKWKDPNGELAATESDDAEKPTKLADSIEFNGSSMKVADNGYGLFDLQEYTLAMYIYIPQTVSDFICFWSYDDESTGGSNYSQHLRMTNDGSELRYLVDDGSVYEISAFLSNNDYNLGDWNFIVIRWKQGHRCSLRINNVEADAKGVGPEILYGDNEVRIGNSPNMTTFNDGVYKAYMYGFYPYRIDDLTETKIYNYVKKK
jgi:hypothetical protein